MTLLYVSQQFGLVIILLLLAVQAGGNTRLKYAERLLGLLQQLG